MMIEKRDGSIVPFDKQKIINAINKAFLEVDGELYETDTAESIAQSIMEAQNGETPTSVETIQDMVEEELMASERKDVARAYVRYRYKKEVAREKRADFDRAIEEKLLGKNKENKNANLDETSFGGRMGEAADVVMRDYALNHLVSEKARKNHLENRIYIHDLSHYVLGDHNCLTIPFDDLLAKGFNTRQVDIRPANSISTALQLVAVIFQLQSLCQFGGTSASHIDWTLIPYVRKTFSKHLKEGAKYLLPEYVDIINLFPKEVSFDDKIANDPLYKTIYDYALDMTEKDIHQGVEALYHNLNSLQSRSGNQLNLKVAG